MALQPSQPLLCIVNFKETMIGVFPEGEECIIMFDGFCILAPSYK